MTAVLSLIVVAACILSNFPASSNPIKPLSNDQFYTTTLAPNSTLYFSYTSTNPGSPCSTLDCQSGDRWVRVSAHAQFNQLQIVSSLGRPLVDCNHPDADCQAVTGRSTVGLVHQYGSWDDLQGGEPGCYTPGSLWTPSPNNTVYFSLTQLNTSSVEVAIVVSSASITHPVPGGCATTGPTPNDPMLELTVTRSQSNKISFQQSNLGLPRVFASPQHGCSCDAVSYYSDTSPGTIQYEVYRTFVSDCGSDFKRTFYESPLLKAIGFMTTVAGVKRHGTKVTLTSLKPPAIKSLEAAVHSGQGVVYNVLVTDVYQASLSPDTSIDEFQSVYTPTHTYSCTLDKADTTQPYCHNLRDDMVLSSSLIAAFAGVPLAFFGLRYYTLSLIIMGSMTGCMVFFIFINNVPTSLNYVARTLLSLGLGQVGGLTAYLWWRFRWSASLTLVYIGTCMGFLVACWVFATPLAEMTVFSNAFNYGMTFACATLLIPTLLLLRPRLLTILSTAVVGSYCIINGVDYFTGGSFGEVYSNVIERAVDPTFAASYTGSYFSDDFNGCSNIQLNLIMLGSWVVLCIITATTQLLWTAKSIPDVPVYSGKRRHPAEVRDYQSFAPRAEDPRLAERRPLLQEQQSIQTANTFANATQAQRPPPSRRRRQQQRGSPHPV
eukprot:m.187551 g.187551  ORF g.187551 m.187551 type:complete len:660 (-) comp16930_c0_seq2:1908-3887(-)